ncbi:ECF RNA polymerase sigma factor SigH [Neolewinella maritima]|uniref:ECF RNA polymerase sigma factor SigH n=1 Tax=Neolewinella maritima TaxID=1383882 RepID=A0ABM9AX69_9BACT|nr:RNA polymerase sigma factor [Neolewinella maritima]CAH0998752.1 ECF RNA polymerase sigma factor SigH [Neolewinella maritima]
MPPFTTIAASVRDRLYRLALRMVGDDGEAEDVVQEVLLSGWQRRREIEALDNPPAWLLKMTHNRAIDRLRSRRVRTTNERAAAVADQTSRTPHCLAESADTLGHIHRLMQQLPADQRSVLQLREVEGLPYREIAETTGLTVDQVKVYLHRGRGKLRQLLLHEQIVER